MVQWDCRETSGQTVLPVPQSCHGWADPPWEPCCGFVTESIRLLIASVRKLLVVTKSCDGTAPDRGPACCRSGVGDHAGAAGGRSPTPRMTLRHAPEQERLRVDPDRGAPEGTPWAEADACDRGFAPFALRDRRAMPVVGPVEALASNRFALGLGTSQDVRRARRPSPSRTRPYLPPLSETLRLRRPRRWAARWFEEGGQDDSRTTSSVRRMTWRQATDCSSISSSSSLIMARPISSSG